MESLVASMHLDPTADDDMEVEQTTSVDILHWLQDKEGTFSELAKEVLLERLGSRYQEDDDNDIDGQEEEGSANDNAETDSSEEKYVGLVNLGSTCYLNSLIQCLYHLPHFRSAVYEMGDKMDDSMATALQLLFYMMSRDKTPASTKQLTDSFGWKNEELATQQDLHEMCIKLREKLEDKMKGTPSEDAVRHLFHGTFNNVVRTLDGEYESTTKESFYELQLEIKGNKGIMEAIQDLCKPERLDGSNKYKVEMLGKEPVYKDADKFVEFQSFPPVQVVHLKRFEIDYYSENLDQRKLYDRFEYPETLDLTEFEAGLPDDDKSNEGNPLYEKGSPAIYEIQSVIVHSGGPRAGHYYAYIRPDMDDRWYEFNDAVVRNVGTDKVFDAAYGGKTWVNGWGVEQVATATSYILIYTRKSCFEKIFKEPQLKVPQGVVEAYEEIVANTLEEEILRLKASKQVLVHVARPCDINNAVDVKQVELFRFPLVSDSSFCFEKVATVKQLREELYEYSGIKPDQQRLWSWAIFAAKCSTIWDAPVLSPSDSDETTLSERWGHFMPADELYSFYVFLEDPQVLIPSLHLFGPCGINIAPHTKVFQSSTYRQPKKGVSHPAIHAIRGERRLFSQTASDDPSPKLTLKLPSLSAINKVVMYNRNDPKFAHRFQNVNLQLFRGDCKVSDYKADRQSLFNPRNILRRPMKLQVEYDHVIADRVVLSKDNSDYPSPPPVSTNEPLSGDSPVYEYQYNYDTRKAGYPCTLDRGAWARNRALSVGLAEVWVDPPPPPPAGDMTSKVLAPFHPSSYFLVMLKYYDPKDGHLTFMGSQVVHQQKLVKSLEPVVLQLAGLTLEEGDEVLYFDEASCKRVYPIDSVDQTFKEQGITHGNIITFQVFNKSMEQYGHPTALSYYEYLADQVKVFFDRFDKDVPCVELTLPGGLRYVDIVEIIGERIGEDPDYIRLWTQGEYGEPRDMPEKKSENRTMREMITAGWEVVPYVYYDVLKGFTVEESEERATVQISLCKENGELLMSETLVLMAKSTIDMLIETLRENEDFPYSEDNDNLVLLEIENHIIKGAYYTQCIFPMMASLDREFELRPKPKLPPMMDGREEVTINVLNLHESYHPWTGRTMTEVHSAPFQVKIVEGEMWSDVLARYMLCYLPIQLLTQNARIVAVDS